MFLLRLSYIKIVLKSKIFPRSVYGEIPQILNYANRSINPLQSTDSHLVNAFLIKTFNNSLKQSRLIWTNKELSWTYLLSSFDYTNISKS